jgi:hypothetical protein
MAATHTDTDHPHAHLLVNGIDKAGKDIRFDKLFITQTMREMGSQVCTEMIGKQSGKEIKASALQSYTGNRYCPFDESISSYENRLNRKTRHTKHKSGRGTILGKNVWLFSHPWVAEESGKQKDALLP